MTIEKGKEWARPVPPGLRPIVVDSDERLAAEAFNRFHHGDDPSRTLALTPRSGDLLSTVGLPSPRSGEDALAYDLDLAEVVLDEGRTMLMAAHLLIAPSPGRPLVAAMNASWLGQYRVAPRAHPNDGLLDVVSGTMPWRQWPEARRRARTGTHLPHPGLSVQRVDRWEMTFNRPVPMRIDGVRVGRSRSVRLQIIPDAVVMVA